MVEKKRQMNQHRRPDRQWGMVECYFLGQPFLTPLSTEKVASAWHCWSSKGNALLLSHPIQLAAVRFRSQTSII
ncbi:unnamed protein product, partial [Heterobilharzia americana]